MTSTRLPVVGPQVLARVRRNVGLAFDLARRSIFGRYRDTILGVGWSVIHPLIMLAIYAFVFSQVFNAKWEVETGDQVSFAVVLFSGLLLFNFFSESSNQATGIVQSSAQLIKRTSVQSLVLPLSVVASALMTFALSAVPFIIAYGVMVGAPPVTALWFPVVLLPLIAMSAGFALLVASFSVYVRDIQPLTQLFTTLVLFLSPIFYPESAIPEDFQGFVKLSPIGVPLNESKRVLFSGEAPDPVTMSLYSMIAVAMLLLGITVFRRAERGFADVL